MQTPSSLHPPSSSVLSVVIPSWNSGAYLERCLTSLREARSFGIEVIVVDNESTDSTSETVARFADVVTVFIREADQGQSDALNKGYAHAKGDFVCWLNADDEFVPGAIPKLAAALGGTNAQWLTSGTVWIDSQSQVVRCSPPLPVYPLLLRLGLTCVGGPSTFIRRGLLPRIGAFDISCHFAMDTDLWYRMHKLEIPLAVIPGYTWAFRIHEQSKTSHVHLTGRFSAAMEKERLRLFQRHGVASGKFPGLCRQLGVRACGFWSGRDFRAWADTQRYRGRPLSEVKPG